MKSLKDLPRDQRPREKLLEKGAKSLTDQELLAILLGKGTKKNSVMILSKKLIKIIDQKGLDISAKDILGIEGIGLAKASVIDAAFEFVRRRIKPEGMRIKFPSDVLPLIRHYSNRKQEHFICISVNAANEIINIRVVTIGLIDKTHVHPREVLADVITDRASAFIIAHNHPVGDLKPGKEDRDVTIKLKEAGNLLGLRLLDHIIFNEKSYYSFLENHEL